MADTETTVDETTTTTDTGAGTPEKGADGQPFDATRAQRTIDTLRDEVKAGKTAAKELEAARARLREIEDKDKSETEKLAARATESAEKLTAAEARAQELAIRLSVERAARKLNFIDDDDAYQLLDRKAIELDEEGTPNNVEKLLTALSKAKPHLVKAEGDDAGQKPGASRGVPPTPKPAGKPGPQDAADDIYKRMRETAGSSRW